LQLEIENLKQTVNAGNTLQDINEDHCSETPTGGDESDEASSSGGTCGPYTSSYADKDELNKDKVGTEDCGDDIPLSLLVQRRGGNLSNGKVSLMERPITPVSLRTCTKNEIIGRKRVRVLISDDESDHEMDRVRKDARCLFEDVATSGG
jgi:hypothetical protein